MVTAPTPLPPLTARWVETPAGVPSQIWRQYLLSLDGVTRKLAAGNVGNLVNAANDAAAAAAGVQIGFLYRTGNAVQVRLV